jgi:hypothetical protein
VHNTQKKDRKRRDLIKKEEGDTVRHIDRDRHMDYSESFVKEHIEKWVNAWNNHDLKAVLSMYSDDIEFSSPKVKVVFPERKQSKVNNKKKRAWGILDLGLKNYPNLHFTPKQIISQGNICVFEYYAILDAPNKKTSVIEKFEFRDDGLINKSSGFYGATEEE